MTARFHHVGLICSGVARSADFYREHFGFREILCRPGKAGGMVAYLEREGGIIELIQPAGAISSPAAAVDHGRAGFWHLSLAVSDLDATYERLAGKGVIFTEKPRPAFFSEILRKVAFCLDPDGVEIELAELSQST